jgi:hypothetical protein
MSPWAFRRKILYFAIAFIALVILVGIPAFFLTYKAPTCGDGKQNQGEAGIDCGGPCRRLCEAQALSPIVSWKRFIEVTPGNYSLVAYVENPNFNYQASNVSYRFQLFDKDDVLVTERTGTATIYPNKKLPVVEYAVYTNDHVPTRIEFEFTGSLVWDKVDSIYPELRFVDVTLEREESSPRLLATLENRTPFEVSRIPVVALVYDVDGNALAVSKTLVSRVGPNGSAPLVFTWPRPFPRTASVKELVPIIAPLR